MDARQQRSLKEAILDVIAADCTLDEIVAFNTVSEARYRLNEAKWLQGTDPNSIRIDHPTSGAGQTHAHIYGRKGHQIGVVNIDGTGSHGTMMRLSKSDAETLRAHGFAIKDNGLVEWVVTTEWPYDLLFG